MRLVCILKTIFNLLDIDRAVFFTLLSRLWSVGAGLITLALIAHFLSPELQGYYYTFSSLIALQIFAELGLNFALVQFASHEMAQLDWQTDGSVTGSMRAKRRLQSLLQFALVWFGAAALMLLLLLLPAGIFFFSTGHSDSVESKNVIIPWVLLVIFTATNLFISMAAAILEGCGKVSQVAVMRLWQTVFGATVVWLILYLGGTLLAIPASSFAMALVGAIWLFVNQRVFFKDLLTHKSKLPGMGWRKEILPFQWRIALSWASGFFIFQIFTPLLFKTVGPVAAGKMGMTMQIFSAMNGVAMAWITTRAPIYGQLIATGQRKQLDTLFFKGLLYSSTFLLFGILVLLGGLYFATESKLEFSDRVLPLGLFSFLCIASLANHIVFAEATYLRSHKEEPFMAISILSAITTLIMASAFIPLAGLNAAVASYVMPAVFIGLVGGSFIFQNKRRYWNLNATESLTKSVK